MLMKVFWLLLVATLASRTAPVQTRQEDGGVYEQSSCTERRVQYWSERSRDAVQRIKDVRFDLDTKIEVLGDFASTKDLEDYTGKLVESSLDCLNEIFQYGALIFECPPEEEDDATVPKKAVIVDRIRQEMFIIMEHLRDILREGISEQNRAQPQQAQPQQAQPQQAQPQQAQSQQAQSQQAQPQADSPHENPETNDQEDDETKRGAELGLCITRVRQQHKGQDEGSIFQAIMVQCQSKRWSLPLSETQQNQQDDEAKRGAAELDLCIARVRQHQGQDEASILQTILSRCQRKQEFSLPLSETRQNQEDDETKRGAELGLCITRVRQQHKGQDEVSIFQAIMVQCQSKREITTKDPPSEDDETEIGATELDLCIAQVRQQHKGQDEVSIFQAIMVQCQSKQEILFEPFM